jgi:hypothetical protein
VLCRVGDWIKVRRGQYVANTIADHGVRNGARLLGRLKL